jgi:hypothetical protein
MAISAQHTQFVTSPYVNALPAEDLIKVALKKQEMYDEGKKQIKQNLDNYGKLRSNIINENERNYFDQELNKMVKNVQQNAGLDFSNMSNVEAVINLGKPFENDNYIRTALDNGAEYQRRQKELASVPKDKRNADNDLVYMYDIQKHIEGGGLGQKLQKNASYTQYVDIKKKLADIEKDVQGEMSTVYRQGPAGYIEKVDIERKTREQIAARISQSLTPDEQAQIQVHAQAQMYRMGSDVVYQTWVGANKEEALMADQESKKAMYALGDLRKIKNPTAQQLADMQNAERVIKEAQDIKAATRANIDMDPDEFDMGEYLPFFTNRFISGIAGNQVKEVIKTDLKEDKVYLKNMEHRQTMSEIYARGAEDRKNAQFENELEYITQSGASTNLLKGISKVVTNVTGATGSDKVNSMIAQVRDNAKLGATVKDRMTSQLETLKRTYEYAEANKDKGYVVSINRSLGNGYVTSVEDFLSSDPVQLIESGVANSIEVRAKTAGGKSGSKTPEQIEAEEGAKTRGDLNAKAKFFETNPELGKMLFGKTGTASGGSDKPLTAEDLKNAAEAIKKKNDG